MSQPSSTQPETQATLANGDNAKTEIAKSEGAEKSVPTGDVKDTPAKVESGEAKAAESAVAPAASDTPATPAPTQPEPAKPADAAAAAPTAPAPAAPAPAFDKPAEPAPAPAKPAETVAAPEPAAAASKPAAVQAAPSAADFAPPKADETFKVGDPSFLYVEDDPFSREVITRLIKQNMGFPNLTVFADSSDFIARVKGLPAIPDVFLLDIQISPLSGHQMLKLLRDDETFKKSKIIALTASVMASEVKQLQDAGFDGLIGKPVMKRVFPELLQKVLDGEPVWYVS